MTDSKQKRQPRKSTRRESLLAKARRLTEARERRALCAMAQQVERAPKRDRPALARLVGSALVESQCGQQALALYARALSHKPPVAERVALHLLRARALLELFEAQAGLEEVDQAWALLKKRSIPSQEAATLTVEAALRSAKGQQEEARRCCLRAIERCDAQEQPQVAVEAFVALSLASLRRGLLDEAERWARQAVERADESTGLRRADALRTLAVVNANRNEFMAAIVSCRRALRIYREHHSQRGLFRGYLSLGICYLAMGELDHAELFLGKCHSIAENGDDHAPRSLVYSRLGHVALVRGEPGEALKYYQLDRQLSAEMNNPISRGHPELNLGQALLALRKYEAAATQLEQALGFFAAVEDPVGQARTQLALAQAKVWRAVEDEEAQAQRWQREASSHLWHARQLVEPLDRTDLTCLCDVTEALLLAAAGQTEASLARYQLGVAEMERVEDVAASTHAAFRMAELLEQVQARDQAVGLYFDALRSAEAHQLHALRRKLLRRLDALDEDVIVDRSLQVGTRRGLPSKDLMRHKVRTEDIRGSSAAILEVHRKIERVAGTDVPVLIQGKTGTGKELVARAIHFASGVSGRLVVLNCGAIARDLVESELFGHARGAFTGAVRSHVGCFERANRGTVFLDEVGDLPLDAQVKLLRTLSTGEVRRVGETATFHVNVRVIAATHRDLPQALADESFREDLYWRLAIFEINTPALREIRNDIPELAQHFLSTIPLALDRGIHRLSTAAHNALVSYHWPGNVRELENVIRRACVVCDGPTLLLEHLPQRVRRPLAQPNLGSACTLKELERRHILQTLADCGGNQSQAARRLGIHRNTLRRKLEEMEEEE